MSAQSCYILRQVQRKMVYCKMKLTYVSLVLKSILACTNDKSYLQNGSRWKIITMLFWNYQDCEFFRTRKKTNINIPLL